jgi:hypothetical protein
MVILTTSVKHFFILTKFRSQIIIKQLIGDT